MEKEHDLKLSLEEKKIDLEIAKMEAEISILQRKERLSGWNEYIGFVTVKVGGLVALIAGLSELLVANLLPIVLEHPAETAGFGFALLVGRSVIDNIESFREKR